MGRVFNSVEEAIETLRKEYEDSIPKSGILCQCSCSKKESYRKYPRPISTCLVLVSKKDYQSYMEWSYPGSRVEMIKEGVLKVRLHEKPRENYTIESNLCSKRFNIEKLLRMHSGKKIRLGKNLLV